MHWVQVSKCPTLTHLISRSMNSALSGSLDCRAFLSGLPAGHRKNWLRGRRSPKTKPNLEIEA